MIPNPDIWRKEGQAIFVLWSPISEEGTAYRQNFPYSGFYPEYLYTPFSGGQRVTLQGLFEEGWKRE